MPLAGLAYSLVAPTATYFSVSFENLTLAKVLCPSKDDDRLGRFRRYSKYVAGGMWGVRGALADGDTLVKQSIRRLIGYTLEMALVS